VYKARQKQVTEMLSSKHHI